MKNYLKSLIQFTFFSVIFYIVVLFFWGSLPYFLRPNLTYKMGVYGHMNTRLKELKNVSEPDILFLGSSHTYRGFDPRIFEKANYTTFNLGSSAQSPIQTYLLLNRYLDQVKPKTIIYETYAGAFSNDGIKPAIDVISNDENDIHSLKMALELNHIKVYNSLLYGWMRGLFSLDSDFKEPLNKEKDSYIQGGYIEREVEYFKYEEYPEKRNWELKEFQLEAFDLILEELEERDMEVILVQAPVTESLYDCYENNAFFDSLMMSYGNPYFNFNKLITLDDSLHFFDPSHLNQLGVDIFNEKLIELLEVNRQ